MRLTILIASIALAFTGCDNKNVKSGKPPAKKPAAKKGPAKKEPAKKAPVKKAPVKKAPVKKGPVAKTTPFADIPFKPFNPKKPKGVNVYVVSGDMMKGGFTAIVRLPPGHSSPLHTHTSGYTGVTLTDGHVHSVTGKKGKPLAAGSFWYQPGGEPHVDACVSKTFCYCCLPYPRFSYQQRIILCSSS